VDTEAAAPAAAVTAEDGDSGIVGIVLGGLALLVAAAALLLALRGRPRPDRRD
jgi:hypothetical protein